MNEALRLTTAVNNHLLMGRAMNFLAINLAAERRREEGIRLSFQALDQLMLAGHAVRAANIKINMGMDYNNQGKYETPEEGGSPAKKGEAPIKKLKDLKGFLKKIRTA